jgi:hypothetical protein
LKKGRAPLPILNWLAEIASGATNFLAAITIPAIALPAM